MAEVRDTVSAPPSLRPSVLHLLLGRLFFFQVFHKLQDISNLVNRGSSTSSQWPLRSFPGCPPPVDSSVTALSQELSRLGPLEDTYQPAQSSQSSSSSSSSSFCSLQSLHRLHSPSSLVSSSSSRSLSPFSLAGPCETDESRGFSQYDLQSQLRTNGTAWRCGSPSARDQYRTSPVPPDQPNQPSVPTEERHSLPLQHGGTSTESSLQPKPRRQPSAGAATEVSGIQKSLSSVRSLQSVFPRPSGGSGRQTEAPGATHGQVS